jgi:homospermidine synthase
MAARAAAVMTRQRRDVVAATVEQMKNQRMLLSTYHLETDVVPYHKRKGVLLIDCVLEIWCFRTFSKSLKNTNKTNFKSGILICVLNSEQ